MSDKIKRVKITELQPDPNNLNQHTQRGHTIVENSMRKRGLGRGILAAGKGVDNPVVMAGNLTLEKAVDAGFENVILVHTTGNELVVTVRDDLAPDSAEAIALAIEDNESSKQSYNPDIEVLAALAQGENAVLAALRKEDKVFSRMLERMGGGAKEKYTRKITAPIYEVRGEKPSINDLYNDDKTRSLIEDINNSDIPQDVKNFLIIAAQRHTILDFRNIAEYYAHSPANVQRLMEDSALVIIDFNRAIELGYVKLSKEVINQFILDNADD